MQDLRAYPCIGDWLSKGRMPERRWLAPNDDALMGDICRTVGIADPTPARAVLELLCTAERFVADKGVARSLLMNSFGPPLVRRILGPAYSVQGRVFDPSWVAEGIIVANFGRIESLQSVLSGLPLRFRES